MKTFLATLLTASALASPALAQSKAELAAQDARMQQRIVALEQRMLSGDPAAERILQRVDALEATVRNLTGEVEQLRFERDQLQEETKLMADELREVQALRERWQLHLDAVDMVAAGGVPTMARPAPSFVPMPSAGTTAPTQPAPSNTSVAMSSLISDGQARLAEGRFAEAETAFAQYVAISPDAPDIGEAQFWLGEARRVRGNVGGAAEAYIASMKADGRGPRAPEAMVGLGASLRELGKQSEACQTLNAFGAQYPEAEADVKEKAATELARTGC